MSEPVTWPLDDLITIDGIAAEHWVTRMAVHAWIRRKDDFPPPLVHLGQLKVYSRAQVAAWRTADVSRKSST